VYHGGLTTYENLRTSCRRCNALKGRGRFATEQAVWDHIQQREKELEPSYQMHLAFCRPRPDTTVYVATAQLPVKPK
jgi:hypothetical protein